MNSVSPNDNNNNNNDNCKEQYYRVQLERIFGDGHWEFNTDHPGRVLEILQACPRLALETFEDAGGEWLFPLSFFLTSRSAMNNNTDNYYFLDLLRQLYALYPDAISQPCGNDQELPLHMACWRALPQEVVTFLARSYPEGLLHRTAGSGLLPVHLALIRAGRDDTFRSAALEVVQVLLHLYPEQIPLMQGPEGESLLEFVFSFAYRKDLVDLVLQWERYPRFQKFSVDRTSATETASPALDLQQATILGVQLLPHVTHFECCPKRWTSDAFIFLMECLQKNTSSLESIGLRLPRDILLSNPKALASLGQLFQTCCSNNSDSNLKKISLSGGRTMEELQRFQQAGKNGREMDDDSAFLQVLASSLQQWHHDGHHPTSSLEVLLLSDFLLPGKALVAFLSSRVLPQQKLALYRVALTDIEDDNNNNNYNSSSASWNHSECTSLTLFNCLVLPSTLKNLLVQFARMPSLQQLAVGINKRTALDQGVQSLMGLDVTESVVHLLHHATQLQDLTIWGPVVRTRALADALKYNTMLRHYVGTPIQSPLLERELTLVRDTLEHDNTTLEGLDLDLPKNEKCAALQEQISYYTKLNDFGRRPLRKGYLTRAELVEFLCFAAANQDYGPEDVLNVHYGLLRELPTLWCHYQTMPERLCGTKRKCQVCLDCCTTASR